MSILMQIGPDDYWYHPSPGSSEKDKYIRVRRPFQFKDGSFGIPVMAFRHAMIHAAMQLDYCREAAKSSILVTADGADVETGIPLVRITKGKPQLYEVKWKRGWTIGRPMFRAGWRATVKVKFDATVFSAREIKAILRRAGQRVGMGCCRPVSPNHVSLGWGTFKLRRA